MDKRYGLIMLILTCGICEGQNLVSNPSFEEHVGCPDGIGQVSKATGWVSVRNHADYFNSCAPTFYFSVPDNDGGFQYPPSQDCSAYMGLFTYPVTREYFGIQLSSLLTVGLKYYGSFKAVLLTSQYAASNNIGMLFTTQLSRQGEVDSIQNFSQIRADNIISDTLNWTTVFGSFVADSAYTCIQIGNFYDDSNTVVSRYSTSYYLVDDVCVSTDSAYCANYIYHCTVGVPDRANISEITVFPNPFGKLLNIRVQDNEVLTMVLRDVTSKESLRQTFAVTATINTEQLSRGMYFYELRNSDGTIRKGKVVKQ